MTDRTGWLCIGVAGGHAEDFHQLVSWCSEAAVPCLNHKSTSIKKPFLEVDAWPQHLVKVVEDEDSRTCYVWVDLQPHQRVSPASKDKDFYEAAQESTLDHERACLSALLLLFLTAHVVVLPHEGTQLKVTLLSKLRALQTAKFQMWQRLGLGGHRPLSSQHSADMDEDEDGEHEGEGEDAAMAPAVDALSSNTTETLKEMLLQRPPTLFCFFQVENTRQLPIQDVYGQQAELNAQVRSVLLRCRVLPPSQTQPLLFHLHTQQVAVLLPALVPSPSSVHMQLMEALITPSKPQGPQGALTSMTNARGQYWSGDTALAQLEALLEPERSYAEGTASNWSVVQERWQILANTVHDAMTQARPHPLDPPYFTMPLKAPGRSGGPPNAVDAAARVLEACTGLAYKFSAAKCRKAVLTARDTYLQAVPSTYTQPVHEAALLSALHVYNAAALGPAASEYRQHLKSECWAEWNAGRRMCGAISLTGHVCKKGPHQDAGIADAHSSGIEWVLAPGPGTTLVKCADPFDFEAAAALLTDYKNVDHLDTRSGEAHPDDSLLSTKSEVEAKQATIAEEQATPSQLSQVVITLVESHQPSTSHNAPHPSLQLDTLQTSASAAKHTVAAGGPTTTASTARTAGTASTAQTAVTSTTVAIAGTARSAGTAGTASSRVEKGAEMEARIVRASAYMGRCVGVWQLSAASAYDQEAGLQAPGLLPGAGLLYSVALLTGAAGMDASAEDILSAAQFPTLAEALSASKPGGSTLSSDSSLWAVERPQILRNWPGRSPSLPAGSELPLVASPEKPRVLTVHRKGAHPGGKGTAGKGRIRDSRGGARAQEEEQLQIYIGLEYANWHGQRFLATAQQLGLQEHPKNKEPEDKPRDKGRSKGGKARDNNKDKGSVRSSGAGDSTSTAASSSSSSSIEARYLLSHDVPLFLDAGKVGGVGAPAMAASRPSTSASWSASLFQLQRIHVVTPDVPLAFCSKPLLQFQLPQDANERAQLMHKLELPSHSATASSQAVAAQAPGASSASAATLASVAPSTPAMGATTDGNNATEPALIEPALLVQFQAEEELALPQGSHSVIALPLMYGVPETWLTMNEPPDGNVAVGVENGGSNEVGVSQGGLTLLQLLDLQSCNAVLLQGTMLYPK